MISLVSFYSQDRNWYRYYKPKANNKEEVLVPVMLLLLLES